MMKKLYMIFIGLIFTAFLLAAEKSQAYNYTFTTLNFPGATVTSVQGINNLGQVIGSYSSPEKHFSGFLMTAGVFTSIDYVVPGFTPITSPLGLNDLGTIVGASHGGFIYSWEFYPFELSRSRSYQSHGY